jgi:hypothetical protein
MIHTNRHCPGSVRNHLSTRVIVLGVHRPVDHGVGQPHRVIV